MKNLLFFAIIITTSISGCSSKKHLLQSPQDYTLADDEGFLGIGFNSLNYIRDIRVKSMDASQHLYIGNVGKGISQITIKVPEGQYCIAGFTVFSTRYTYNEDVFCIYVEAGELNYLGHLYPRDPITNIYQQFNIYSALLKKAYPQIHSQFIGS